MIRLGLSTAAAALLRALIARAGIPRDRVLLTHWRSVDWQSLTFVGERHEMVLHLVGPDSHRAATRLAEGLAEAEFAIPGQIVADIAVLARTYEDDGSPCLTIEALTIRISARNGEGPQAHRTRLAMHRAVRPTDRRGDGRCGL
ncbi:hypothetical protein GCM10023325_18380 [Sphingomonas lutea]